MMDRCWKGRGPVVGPVILLWSSFISTVPMKLQAIHRLNVAYQPASFHMGLTLLLISPIQTVQLEEPYHTSTEAINDV